MAKNEASETEQGGEADEPEGKLSDLAAEIDSAVDVATERLRSGGGFAEVGDAEPVEGEKAAPEVASEDAAEAVEDDEPATGRDEKGRFTEAPPKDETIERAVKAGIPIAEAKKYPTDALLAATCGRIEGVQKAQAGEAKPVGNAKDGEAAPADPWAAIPDLDPAEFDEKLVKLVASMKEIGRSQQKELAELRGDRSKGFVATKLEGLKNLTKGDASKEAAVRAKFDVLTAGYKAAKQEVTEEAVFAEAAQLVLGSEVAADKKAKQAEAASKRSGQRIARPTGRNVEAKPDAVAEVADMLDKKFFAAR